MVKIKDFSKGTLSLELPDLLEVQKEWWQRFIEKELPQLFEEFSPVKDYTGKNLELYFEDLVWGEPRFSSAFEAKEEHASFDAPLRVRVRLVNHKTGQEKTQEIFLTYFPLLTEKGTFVVNGVEKVPVSQLIRSPGILFVSKIINGKEWFGANIIPSRGAWLEFETDPSGVIWVKIDKRRRLPVTVLLQAFGIEREEIKDLFSDIDVGEPQMIIKTLEKDKTETRAEALVEIYSRLRPGEMVNPETAREFFENLFFNPRKYDLSEVGRWKLAQRLPRLGYQKKEIPREDRVLRKEDIIETVREIIRLQKTPGSKPDQMDHLSNRRVRPFTEVLLNQIRMGLARMERIIKDRMSTCDLSVVTPAQLINPRPFMAQVDGFFASSQLIQFMDNENPLAELEHKRRLTASGPGGVDKQRAGLEIRDVQPSHYGRLCPIQTPEGPNVGITTYLASYAKPDRYGFLRTPYFKVEKGRVTSEIVYLSALEEENHKIASGVINTDEKGFLLDKVLEGRYKGEPVLLKREEVEFVDVSPQQILSVAASCIPFLNHDDANRALMGSNMQRQAVPLIVKETPLVITGTEFKVAENSGELVRAQEEGEVIEVDAKHIVVKEKTGRKKVYELRTFYQTNKDGCFHQVPVVSKGQKVKKGEILAEGGSVKDGMSALGKNVLVAFMPWRGYTFEDAVLVSERLLKEDLYSSIKIKKYSCLVRETKLGPEVTTWDIPNISEEKLKDLDEEGIIRIGAEVGSHDILVGKIAPKGETDLTPEEKLLKAIFGEKAKDVKDVSLRLDYGEKGRVIDVKIFSREEGYQLEPGVLKEIEIKVAQWRRLKAGDKFANRHGNKGVIAKIVPEEDMPFLEDGTPVDVIFNTLGVGKRMNVGQIFETHLGLAAKKLGYIAKTPSLSGATIDEIKEELKKAGLPEDGKLILYDGRTGKPFDQKVTVGYMYVMKLDHMVEDKIHMRAIGPYSLITQQPLGGKAQFGGQRFGEMEVWALEGHGAAFTLQEMLTFKSDDVIGRSQVFKAILKGEEIRPQTIPASFKLLLSELRSLALNVELKVSKTKSKEK